MLFGLGTVVHPEGHAHHPRAPPVLRPDRARLIVVGDSTLWGVSPSKGKRSQKGEARDVCTYLKSVFSNFKGEGLWGKGIGAINEYLRSEIFDADVVRSYRDKEYIDTGVLSSSKAPY